jgi:DNA/RNA-binding domain of Phe-tRNA-synthetase-like protein
MSSAAFPTVGWRAPEVVQELPSLRLLVTEVEVAREDSLTGVSPPDVQQRLRERSSRFRGARAISIRLEPVPAAYRVFFRHIGLDPDVVRTPIERAVLERMLRGGFPTGGLLADVLLIALIDTGVPVWALASDTLEGPPGIRESGEGESLGGGGGGQPLLGGRLVVADSRHALAVLFDEPAPAHSPRGDTRAITLFTVQVAGVPTLFAEEALWSAASALEVP